MTRWPPLRPTLSPCLRPTVACCMHRCLWACQRGASPEARGHEMRPSIHACMPLSPAWEQISSSEAWGPRLGQICHGHRIMPSTAHKAGHRLLWGCACSSPEHAVGGVGCRRLQLLCRVWFRCLHMRSMLSRISHVSRLVSADQSACHAAPQPCLAA